MLPYRKARKLAETWIDLTTDGACEIASVEDKPYGWVFYYAPKQRPPGENPPPLAGNAPILVDRCDGELRVTGTAYPTEHYLKAYEASLPAARLQMAPESHADAQR